MQYERETWSTRRKWLERYYKLRNPLREVQAAAAENLGKLQLHVRHIPKNNKFDGTRNRTYRRRFTIIPTITPRWTRAKNVRRRINREDAPNRFHGTHNIRLGCTNRVRTKEVWMTKLLCRLSPYTHRHRAQCKPNPSNGWMYRLTRIRQRIINSRL